MARDSRRASRVLHVLQGSHLARSRPGTLAGKVPLLEKEWIKAALEGREKVSEPRISDGEVERAMHDEPLPTVLDADGTQMRALIRVSRGESLVIQGPPGTGKSQTIANIIATALAQGKTVLFMAEKLAALNVVKDRLDQSKDRTILPRTSLTAGEREERFTTK